LGAETTWPTEEDIATGDAGNPNGSFVSLGPVSVGTDVSQLDNIPKDWGRNLPDVSDTIPISPLFGIEELDYALTAIKEHKLNAPEDITERVDPVKYKTPPATGDSEKRLTDVDQKTFSGSVKSKEEPSGGWVVCQVIRADGREIAAHATEKNAANIKVHHPVDVYYDAPTNRHVVKQADGVGIYGFFTILEEGIFPDYLLCSGIDPTTGEEYESIAVAKPYMLQRSPWQNREVDYPSGINVKYYYYSNGTRRRVVDRDEDEDDEYQIITPDYFAGDVLTVVRAQMPEQTSTGEGEAIEWMDLNTGARVWAIQE
jgi:hypothetical protein